MHEMQTSAINVPHVCQSVTQFSYTNLANRIEFLLGVKKANLVQS